ncbi:MAG TPA: GAF domain-containing protein [Thermodesulfobacteriota bacterium]|nr:GAF domain-containing protein [Thermodesulfobacteriota bacterium]
MKVNKSLRLKWMVLSILLSTLPVVIVGYSIIHLYQKNLKKSIITIEKEKANAVVGRTRAYFERITSSLRSLSIDEHFSQGTSAAHLESLLRVFLYQNDYISELTLLNRTGKESIKVSKYKAFKTSDLKDQSKTEMFQTASNLRTYYGGFKLVEDIVPSMVIAIPIEENRVRPTSVLSAEIDLRYLWNVISQTQVGEKGIAYVVNGEGYLVAHPDTGRVTSRTRLRGLPMVYRAVAGEEGDLEFEDSEGIRHLVVFKPIQELGWGVIVQVPIDEAYEPIRQVSKVSLIWVFVVLAVALLLSFLLTRRIALPIKQLEKEMGEVAKGNLDIHIDSTSKDELGTLTQSFNQMIEDLKGSREALRETEEKYRRIFEDSKDMLYMASADGRIAEVNQAGVDLLRYGSKEEMIQAYARDAFFDSEDQKRFMEEIKRGGFVKDFEVTLKRRDGVPIDVLITANTRRNDGGKTIAYEGTIKDISDRKRMEEELIQRTRELEALNEMGALINQTLDIDRVLAIALEKAVNLTGYEMGGIHLVNEEQRTSELKHHFRHSSRVAEMAKALKYGEGVAGRAVTLKRPVIFSPDDHPSPQLAPLLKEEGVQTIMAFPLLGKGKVVGAISLLSRSRRELSQREVRLLESIGNQIGLALVNAKLYSDVAKAKSEWETTFDSVTDLLTIRDKEYRIIRANRAALERFGLKAEELVGKKCFEIFRHSNKPCVGCYVSETLNTKNPVSVELESPYLKGIFRFYTFPIFSETGELIGVVELAREITEEKRLETEKDVVNNVNKILASSLDVKQAMQAIHSELKRMLDCEKMGVALFDEEKKGFHYLVLSNPYERAGLFAGPIYPQERTPFGRVIETGMPVIVTDNTESDSWVAQKLLKEEIHSSLLFPLEYKGKVIGTMNFGSKEVNHFSEASFELLRQVAPGVAISIQNTLLFNEIKKRLDELTILYEITKIFTSASFSMDQMLTEVAENLNNLLKFDYLVIFLVEENTKRLKPYVSSKSRHHAMDRIEKLELRVGKGITGWVAEKGEPLLVSDVREDARYLCGDEIIFSEMCVPLKLGPKVIGVIDAQSRTLNAFSEDDLRLFSIAGGQLTTFIENLRLYEEIKQSEEKYRAVVEGVHDGVAVLGTDFKFKYVNNRLSEIMGYSKGELVGMDFRRIVTEKSRQLVVDRYVKWVKREEAPHFEFDIFRKDGETRHIEIRNKQMRDSEGNLSVVTLMRDITEEKKTEEQLFQAEKLRALAEMASGVAHDFNNALAAILGNTQLLLYTAQDEELRETLHTIEKVAKDSSQTVRRLQDFTKKRVHQELFSVDVNSIVKDSIEITKPKWKDEAQSKGVHIEVSHHLADIPPASGNDSDLRGVFTNLIFNAIEAMPQGGKIEIRTFRRRENIIIQVSDSGIGIAEEAKKKIFEPFFTTKPFTNTGLGLSMSYGIIKRFGGEIEVESKVGEGTTFIIILPVGEKEREEDVSLRTITQKKQARILVIDDEEFVRSVLSRMLSKVNHQVILAADGQKGVELFREGKYDLVLTDLGMPGMSGWEVCRNIKKISPDTPVGMITGWGAEMSECKMQEYGLDFIISKPFDINQVLNVVAETMQSKGE